MYKSVLVICGTILLAQAGVCQTMSIHMDGTVEEFQLSEIDSITFTTVEFPVTAELFLDHTFNVCEGIAFNGEGQLYVAGNQALWSVSQSGEITQVTTGYSNLGLAPTGDRDILFCDFGPTNAFVHGPNNDGMVWHVTPEGVRTVAGENMGDPNFVLKLPDGRFLVSDDATDEIFVVDTLGVTSIFTQSVQHPNGMVLSLDENTLYIAQMFQAIHPVWDFDGSIWALQLVDGSPSGDPVEIVNMGDEAGIDGLAQDILGRVYIACWNAGEIWRFDPDSEELVLICENVPGVASFAFGQGDYGSHYLYATSTLQGSVWRIPVGVAGAELYR